MKKLHKREAKKEVSDFFKNIKNKSPKEIKKIKKLAMKYNIKLREKRKLFCKKCYSADLRIKSLKNKMKTIECKDCENISRYKIKRG